MAVHGRPRQDRPGRLYLYRHRKKDSIISGGQNIVSKEIEDVLYEFPGVLEAPRSAFPMRNGVSACTRSSRSPTGTRLPPTPSCRHSSATGWQRSNDREKSRFCPRFPRTPSGRSPNLSCASPSGRKRAERSELRYEYEESSSELRNGANLRIVSGGSSVKVPEDRAPARQQALTLVRDLSLPASW